MSFTVTHGLSGTAERRRALSRYIRLPNVGLANKQTCGDAPLLGTALTATWNGTGVDLRWNAATDEVSGERDVTRYVIFRRLATDLVWGDPYLSIPPASLANYLYTDGGGAVTSGAQYVYGLAAQDCTPTNSTLTPSATVTIP